MATFEEAVKVILAHEGGFVNDPHDPGGATNWGISSRFLLSVGIHVKAEDISKEQAIALYRTYFWQAAWEALAQRVATKLLDMSVNMGAKQAMLLAQEALWSLGELVAFDGVFGLQTATALQRPAEEDLLRALCKKQSGFYTNLAESKPPLRKFLHGWLIRAAWPYPSHT